MSWCRSLEIIYVYRVHWASYTCSFISFLKVWKILTNSSLNFFLYVFPLLLLFWHYHYACVSKLDSASRVSRVLFIFLHLFSFFSHWMISIDLFQSSSIFPSFCSVLQLNQSSKLTSVFVFFVLQISIYFYNLYSFIAILCWEDIFLISFGSLSMASFGYLSILRVDLKPVYLSLMPRLPQYHFLLLLFFFFTMKESYFLVSLHSSYLWWNLNTLNFIMWQLKNLDFFPLDMHGSEVS